MRKIIQTVFLFYYGIVSSQNLVPNFSFEQYDTCPISSGQIDRAIPWFQPNKCCLPGGSTDYFHSCTINPSFSVPQNGAGYQNARMGIAYAGIVLFSSGPEFREYLEVRLNNSLLAGKSYCLEFYVSLANRSQYATSSIGVLFSNDSITCNGPFTVLPYVPQFENDSSNYLTDTLNWMKVSGTYIASGNEQYITIGNFSNDANTDTSNLPGTNSEAYYYIDDVSVILCDTVSIEEEFFLPSAFSPNNDGNNDLWRIAGEKPDAVEIAVYDRWGNEVFRTADPAFSWDGSFKGKALPMGVYFYYMKGMLNEEDIFEKGNLTLVR